jgi:hypothetical protein
MWCNHDRADIRDTDPRGLLGEGDGHVTRYLPFADLVFSVT